MDFQLSDDAVALAEAACRFLTAEAGAPLARRVMESGAPLDDALWRKIVEQGWPAVRAPEAAGGLDLSPEAACVLAEELGRSLAPVPLLSSLAVVEALRLAASDSARSHWLPRLASGEATACLAWAEGTRSPLAMPATRLEGGRLSGTKSPVADGRGAAVAVVSIAADGGPAMALVDLSAQGVTRTEVETLDLVRPAAALRFEGAAAELLGGPADWQTLVQRLAVLHAFEALGTAQAAMEMTLAYARERQAFGLRIGRYQAVKHKLADIYVKLELARAHALHGVWAWSATEAGTASPHELAQSAAAARVASLDALALAAEETVQLHGGIGFTWEHDAQLYYRRNRQIASALGSRAHWTDQLVRALESRNRAAA